MKLQPEPEYIYVFFNCTKTKWDSYAAWARVCEGKRPVLPEILMLVKMKRYATVLPDVLIEIKRQSSLDCGCRTEINRLETKRSAPRPAGKEDPFRWVLPLRCGELHWSVIYLDLMFLHTYSQAKTKLHSIQFLGYNIDDLDFLRLQNHLNRTPRVGKTHSSFHTVGIIILSKAAQNIDNVCNIHITNACTECKVVGK